MGTGGVPKLLGDGNKGDYHPQLPIWKKVYNVLSTLVCCGIMKNQERPTSHLTINGLKAMALWDSGADLSCISGSLWKRIKKKPPLIPYRNTLTAANGQVIRSRGVARLHFQFGDYKFDHNVVVLDELKTDIIVGVDIMRQHNIVLDMGRRKIMRRPFEYHKEKVNPATDGIAKTSYVLEPMEAAVIDVATPSTASIGQNFLASGPHVPQGITITNDKRENRILIVNKQIIPIQIRRGDKVCTLEEVKVNHLIENQEEMAKMLKDTFKTGVKDDHWWRHDAMAKYQSTPTTTANLTLQSISTNDVNSSVRVTSKTNNVNNNTDIVQHKLTDAAILDSMKEVPAKYKLQFKNLVRKFEDVFSADPDAVGKCDVYPQKITLLDPTKVCTQRSYNVAPNLQHVVESYVRKLLAQGVIEESKSPWSSPLLLIKKPGPLDPNNIVKSFRIAHDYRKLNSNTLRNSYPLNSVFHLLDRVGGAKIISVLDIASGFWNQVLDEESRPYTAFSVPGMGHYMYTRSAQGLVNSSPCWQRLIDFVISGVPDSYVFVDDIILASDSVEKHLEALEQLFLRFRKHNLKIRVHKVKFGASKVTYLGWDIDVNSGLKPGEIKTKAILNYKEPSTLTELKGFLGLSNFFRRCIPFYSHKVKPLTKLTRNDAKWKGGPLPVDAKTAFLKIKKLLGERPCLKPIKWDRPFYISVDSSGTGTGAVLSQRDDQGIEHPNLYLSKTHAECKKNKSAFQLEAEGIIWVVKQLRCIIQASEIIIRTDHKPLSSVDRSSSPYLDKVYAELSNFNFKMEYMKGQSMIADGLSRQSDHSNCLLCRGNTSDTITTIGAITHAQSVYEDNQGIIDITKEQIVSLQKEDKYLKAIICYLKYNLLPTKYDLRKWVMSMAEKTSIIDGILGTYINGHFKVLAPLHMRETLLTLAHKHEWGGHLNWKRTMAKLYDWHWSNMSEDVKKYCQACTTCQQNNAPPGGHTKMALGKLESPHKFNSHCHLDLLGPLPESGIERFKYCLVITDAYSGFIKVIPLVTKAASEVSKAFLTGWISHFAIPNSCTMDQGSEFVAEVFRNLCSNLGTKLQYSSVEHAMSNGKCERQMRNILSYLRKFIDGKPSEWSHYLPSLMSALNTSIHSDKLHTPYELVFGYKPTISTNYVTKPLNYEDGGLDHLVNQHFKLQEQVKLNYDRAFDRNKNYYDAKLNEHFFKINDIVYLKSPSRTMKLLPRYIGPLRIVEVQSNNNMTMQHVHTGKVYKAHSNRLKLGKHEDQIFQRTETAQKDLNAQNEKFMVNAPAPTHEARPLLQNPPPADVLSQPYNLRRRNRPAGQSQLVQKASWQPPNKEADEEDDENELNDDAVDVEENDSDVLQHTDANLPTSGVGYHGPLTRARRKMIDPRMVNVMKQIKKWSTHYNEPI